VVCSGEDHDPDYENKEKCGDIFHKKNRSGQLPDL